MTKTEEPTTNDPSADEPRTVIKASLRPMRYRIEEGDIPGDFVAFYDGDGLLTIDADMTYEHKKAIVKAFGCELFHQLFESDADDVTAADGEPYLQLIGGDRVYISDVAPFCRPPAVWAQAVPGDGALAFGPATAHQACG